MYFVSSIAHSDRSISQLISQINRDFNHLGIFSCENSIWLSVTQQWGVMECGKGVKEMCVVWEWMEERKNSFFSFINNKLRCYYCVLCLQFEESLTSSRVLLVFAWGPNNETRGKFRFSHRAYNFLIISRLSYSFVIAPFSLTFFFILFIIFILLLCIWNFRYI